MGGRGGGPTDRARKTRPRGASLRGGAVSSLAVGPGEAHGGAGASVQRRGSAGMGPRRDSESGEGPLCWPAGRSWLWDGLLTVPLRTTEGLLAETCARQGDLRSAQGQGRGTLPQRWGQGREALPQR